MKVAIGRFGLMDGQSLFSYNGIFPPEPSAWEKIYLGWISPVVISSGSGIFKIPTNSKTIQRDTSVYKVLISSKEYFLIENRNRDQKITDRSFIQETGKLILQILILRILKTDFIIPVSIPVCTNLTEM